MTDPELAALIRQGLRYYVAARQDQNPVIAHLHANYAVTYLEIARHGATTARVQRVAGIQIDRALQDAKRVQDDVQRTLLRFHPVMLPAWG